jgi:HemY protein
VAVDWQGWRIETTLGVAVLAGLLLVVVAALSYATWRGLRRAPRAVAVARRERRRAAGYRALTDGLVAVAAGDADAARRQARLADGLLNEPPLTLLLSAQAAQLSGDAAAAKRDFEAMLERPETEFLGLRGLIVQALKDHDAVRALALTRRAYGLRPATPWVLETLIDLHSKAGDWAATQKFLAEARRVGAAEHSPRTREAALLAERARVAIAAGRPGEALDQARRAHDLDPTLAPATAMLARQIARDGRTRRARRIVESAWTQAPHPSLVPVYLDIVGVKAPLDRYAAVQRLVEDAPDRPESRLALAEAAVEARLWGEARRQVDALAPDDASVRSYRLRARIAEGDLTDESNPQDWLDRAAGAPADPAWVCRRCGTISDGWTGVCGNCGELAGLAWTPPRRIHLVAPGDDMASVATAAAAPLLTADAAATPPTDREVPASSTSR